MKKIIAVLLCGALMFSLSACSIAGRLSQDINDEIVDTDNGNKNDEKENDEKLSRGVISGDEYENSFAKFTFTKPSDWNYLTDEEIASTINVGQELVDVNALEKALAEKSSFYDMAAKNDMGDSVMVLYENTEISAGKKYTADEYIKDLKNGLKSANSITYTFGDTEDVTLGNTTYKKLPCEGYTQGVSVTQSYYIKVVGKYVIGVIITSVSEDEADIENMFS